MIKRFYRFLRKNMMSCEDYARKVGVKVGNGCFISTKEFPSEGYLIEIGDYVRIAPKTSFYTHGGIWTLRKIYDDKTLDYFGKIKIGDYTYIGESCMIMAGVNIGKRCIVGAGTVVTKNIPDGCMVAGNPCKFIGYTEDFYKRVKANYNIEISGLSREEKKKVLLSLDNDKFITKPDLKTTK